MKKRQQENLENLIIATEFQQNLKEDTDRTCVLLAATFLESELERLLETKLVGDAEFKYHLFDIDAPLGTLSAKTRICYSLGFISKQTMENIALIELLNNAFEEHYNLTSFEDLMMNEKVYKLTSNLYFKNEVPPRRYFSNVAYNTAMLIHSGYKKKCFKEKIQLEIDADTKLKQRNEIEKLANEIINELNKK